MSGTRVMTLGSLDQGAGLPEYGGPIPPPYEPGGFGPDWRINRHYPEPTTPQVPQNLQRPTRSGCDSFQNYSGKPIAPILAGALAPSLGAGAAPGLATADTLRDCMTYLPYTQVSYAAMYRARSGMLGAVGAAVGAYHGYRRSNGSLGSAIGWGLLGALFPVITTGVVLFQGPGQRK